jgi:hypothetical protein
MPRWATRTAIRALAIGLFVYGLAQPPPTVPAVDLGASTAPVAVTSQQVAVPPPAMGWASWNSFASEINYATIKAQADAMVSSGMAAAGYQYVNIDEGWWWGDRASDGTIVTRESQFPGGMKAIADYIHSKGLKAGIYTDAGNDGCGYYYPTPEGTPAAPGSGSEGHYEQDMRTFQEWGFDFVKVDWCGGDAEGLDQATTYRAISAANDAAAATTGRKLVLSFCEWGTGNPWNWAPGAAEMWRTSTDIIFWGQSPTNAAMLANFDKSLHPGAQHTGFYNDPDMLMTGMSGFTAAQNRTHMSLWAIAGAPLLAGNNLATMTSATAAILSNAEMIAIDQDARGLQGVKVAEDTTGLQVYSKVLSGTGKRAVVLLNRTSAAASITARWADMGLTTAAAAVRNVWSASNVGSPATSYTATVPAGEAVLLTVTGTEAAGTTYEAEATTNTRAGSAATATCANCSGSSLVGSIGNGAANTLTFNGVSATASGVKLATIAYVNGDSTARRATLQVNGQTSTVVSFPPTGSWTTPGTVSVLLNLAKGSTNTLKFSNTTAWAPDVDAIQFQDLTGTNGTELIGTGSGRCVGLADNTIVNLTQATLGDCVGGQNQTFTVTSRSELVVYGNKCLDANNNGTTDGTKVIIWDCNGGTNQKWTVNTDGTITNNLSGKCLDAYGAGTASGTLLNLWTCNSQTNQKWTLN